MDGYNAFPHLSLSFREMTCKGRRRLGGLPGIPDPGYGFATELRKQTTGLGLMGSIVPEAVCPWPVFPPPRPAQNTPSQGPGELGRTPLTP